MPPQAVTVVAVNGIDHPRREALEALWGRAQTWARAQRGGQELLDDLAGVRSPGQGEAPLHTDQVALLGSTPAGFLRASWEPATRRARLDSLFVVPELRGIGIGHELFSHAVRELRRLGCEGLDAVALPGDRATKNFFEAHGMVTRALVVNTRLEGGEHRW